MHKLRLERIRENRLAAQRRVSASAGLLGKSKPAFLILNKCDLETEQRYIVNRCSEFEAVGQFEGAWFISALKNTGVHHMLDYLVEA